MFRKKVVVPCLEYVFEPFIVFDSTRQIVELNDAMARLLAADRSVLRGRQVGEVEQLKTMQKAIENSITSGTGFVEQIKLGENVYNASIYPVQTTDGRYFGVIFQNITKFINLEEELIRRNKLLMVINTISTVFIYTDEISSIFIRVLEKIQLVTDLDVFWIVIKNDEGIALRSALGVSREFREKLEAGRMNAFHEQVMSLKEPFFVLEGEELNGNEDMTREGIMFLVAQPLSFGPERVGVLVMGNRTPVLMDFELASLIHLIGNHVSLVLEKVRLYEKAEYLAVTDALTGIFNVRYFYDTLELETARAKRYGNPFSISIFDVDDFKAINDKYGHQAGDEVLRTIATIMKRVSREADVVARYGGEEFIMILANTTKDEAFNQASRVKAAVEGERYLGNHVSISISGGIATFPEDGMDEKRLLYAADMALYDAKALGKRQIRHAGE